MGRGLADDATGHDRHGDSIPFGPSSGLLVSHDTMAMPFPD